MRVHKLLPTLMLTGALLLSAGCASAGEAERGEAKIMQTNGLGKTTTYRLEEMIRTDLNREAQLSVELSHQLVRTVNAPGAEYRVKTVCVKRGQHVEAGDPLYILQGTGSETDAELKRLEIGAYESGREEMLATYQTRIEDAEDLPSYTASLSQRRELQIEYARLEYRKYELQSLSTLESMYAQLEQLEAAAGETVLTSPVAGSVRSVSSRYVAGDTVPAGTELCTINADEGFRFLGSSSSGSFVYGREVTIHFKRGNKEMDVTGRVVGSPEVTGGGNGANMILMELDAKEEELLGTAGDANVSYTILKDTFVVPKNSVSTRDGYAAVNLLIGDTVCARNVVRGPMTQNTIAILDGVSEGDRVVISSYNG